MLRKVLYSVYILLTSAILLFGLLEIPGFSEKVAVDLPYYSIRREFRPDSGLVFVHRFAGKPAKLEYRFPGDLYWEGYHVAPQTIERDASYAASGFRVNSSVAPFDVAVIGDSFVELSETDRDSFSELLAARSGLSTLNLGTSWYGPYQYVEVLKRFAVPEHPRYALFMFYDGNDIEDIGQYERWLREGRYHGIDRRYWDASFPHRFAIVAGEALGRVWDRTTYFLYSTKARLIGPHAPAVAPDLALVSLGDDTVPMVLGPFTPAVGDSALLETAEWRSLRRLLESFRDTSIRNGIVPVLVYVPTKMQTFVTRTDPGSGSLVREGRTQQLRYRLSQEHALATIAGELNICYVNLLPEFTRRASAGEVLFHPFDTHWNSRGREVAAERVAAALVSGRMAESPSTPSAGCVGQKRGDT